MTDQSPFRDQNYRKFTHNERDGANSILGTCPESLTGSFSSESHPTTVLDEFTVASDNYDEALQLRSFIKRVRHFVQSMAKRCMLDSALIGSDHD